MIWSVEHSYEEGMLVICFSGDTAIQERAEAAASRADSLVRKYSPQKLLVDITENHARPGPSDMFFLARRHKVTSDYCKIAIVGLPENKEFQTFMHATYSNAGKFYRTFHNHDEALAWLREKS